MPVLTTSDNIRLHYVDEGPRDAPVLLMVPGWSGSARWFEQQISGLSGRFRVVCFDPRGQGESERTEAGQRMERVAKDLHDLITALELREITLLGWSLGVSTVLSYVDVFGCGILRKIVLVCGGPRLINSGEWELGFVDVPQALDWVALQRKSMEEAADFVLPRFFRDERPAEQLARLRAEITSMNPAGSAAMCWNVLNQDYTDVLAKVQVPTLVLTGAHDRVIPAGNGPYLAETISDARLTVFADSAHCPFIEEPARFNEELASFMA